MLLRAQADFPRCWDDGRAEVRKRGAHRINVDGPLRWGRGSRGCGHRAPMMQLSADAAGVSLRSPPLPRPWIVNWREAVLAREGGRESGPRGAAAHTLQAAEVVVHDGGREARPRQRTGCVGPGRPSCRAVRSAADSIAAGARASLARPPHARLPRAAVAPVGASAWMPKTTRFITSRTPSGAATPRARPAARTWTPAAGASGSAGCLSARRLYLAPWQGRVGQVARRRWAPVVG